MILAFAIRNQKSTAAFMLAVFYLNLVLPLYSLGKESVSFRKKYLLADRAMSSGDFKNRVVRSFNTASTPTVKNTTSPGLTKEGQEKFTSKKLSSPAIGGPSQPEMTRFKPVDANNLVNLFTGDFSYNIPLLDVGGYPVNLFYDGGNTPEEEASWVGLGWNINPGTVSRGMRGVPDDFNGTEQLITTQTMKPNITWGGRLGADVEIVGIKEALNFSLGGTVGISFNNYLGPAIEQGIKGGVSFKLASLSASEKSPSLGLGAGINVNLSSRGGLTISPNVSLTASHKYETYKSVSGSLGMSTSYNSRTGIQSLNLNVQGSASFNKDKMKDDNDKYIEKARRSSNSASILSSSISFSKPSYSPVIRMPITNESYAGRFQIGGAIYGVYGSAELEVYRQSAEVKDKDQEQKKPLIGYLYFQKGNNNSNAVLDFSRINDKEVTPNTPIISAPQYAYDVFSINGEGTGGTIRLYRNDDGYVRDNLTTSKDKSINAGVDIGIPGHYGTNINWVKTPTTIGDWNAGNKLKNTLTFKNANDQNENVYFRNPGETSVLLNNQFEHIGGDKLVRYKLGGSKMNPTVEPTLEVFNNETKKILEHPYSSNMTQPRKKRTQVVSFLTAKEASEIGLDKQLKSYNAQSPFTPGKTLNIEYFNRVDEHRLPHHISQINVTEGNGTRYIYGIPVYNIVQKDFTFTVADASPDAEIVNVNPLHMGTTSEYVQKNSPKDGYLQVNVTPAYAHSFLLSGLLSPDYVDVQGDGITEDDLGTAVKFNYTRIKNSGGTWAYHKWRTPHNGAGNTATFNAGNRTNNKDDKGMVSYGERESWYLHSVESKTMIALFTLESRADGAGAENIYGGRSSENALRRLRKIDLYNKADLKKNGLAGAKPVKTVHFEYSYKLCKGDASNPSANKLTLDGIYFTFNGKNRNNKNQYKFSYEKTVNNITTGNPDYSINSTDRWGSYKPKILNPSGLSNADYPYSYQPNTPEEKNTLHQNAGAWNLKKVLLPSGGQIEVEYESDDYAFVQNRRAATMMQVEGFSNSVSGFSDKLYDYNSFGITENTYVLIKVPEVCANDAEVKLKYIQGQEQLAFKLAVHMPKGVEYITSYAYVDANQCGVYGNAPNNRIWVKLKTVSGLSPLSLTALEFLKEQLPGQAFPGYDVSEGTSLQKAGELLVAMMVNLKDAFRDPINTIRSRGDARKTDLSKCFVRLNDPDGRKYGGGYRVKKVLLKDNWQAMTQQFTSVYGTEYNYETTETFNGVLRTISSGVASYEPSIGGDENPFQTMLQVADKLPLGPTSYNAIEMPVLDAFFPAPVVGYSKVTVKSIRKGELPQGSTRSRSGIGTQVTEFYTAKDFPVLYKHTSFDNESDLIASNKSLGIFWFKWINERRTLSQGFLVAINDMHGKMKSQASYAENDPNTRINYTENFYRNTGVKGFDEKFDFVYASQGGKIEQGNMGIDIELMTDVREFKVESIGQEIQAQVDLFPVILPVWLPFIWPVRTKSQNIYRAVTCTKVISYHSIVDKVVVTDKGSTVTTENMVFDAETGAVVVNKRNNEFGKPVYTTTYPAWWAYSGMGLAYKNIDAVYAGINFRDGKIINKTPAEQSEMFESGDEMYVIKQDPIPPPAAPPVITGTVSYFCSATPGNGQGQVRLTFSFASPTPANLRFNVGWVYQNNSGYGGGGVNLPSYALPFGNPGFYDTYYIDVPPGVTSYATPLPVLNTTQNASWDCFDGLGIPYLEKKAFVLKVAGPANYVSNLACTTPGISFLNDPVTVPVPQPNCVIESENALLLWAFDKNKQNTSLTVPVEDFVFMDERGKLFAKNNVTLRVVRSGHRNMLDATAEGITSLTSPVVNISGNNFLKIDGTTKTLNASAIEYREKWQSDNDVFRKYKLESQPNGPNLVVNSSFNNGNIGFQTDYSENSFTGLPGRYRVSCNSSGWFSQAASCYDRNFPFCPGGWFMQVDGASSQNRVWYQTITVEPNTDYIFSCFLTSINPPNHTSAVGKIQFTINDIETGPEWLANVNQCTWVNPRITWNSGNNTTVVIGIKNKNIFSNGNDYAIDDISFYADNTCKLREVEDCEGYWEKSINPYRKGLLGTFRPNRSMVYYDKRAEENATSPTDLPNNGQLTTNFKLYWDFNNQNNLVPDLANPKWVWNSQITRLNAKGMELETKDALNIYTAAQYGYNKTLPLAIANNSRYNEMFYAGFEDSEYDDLLNTSLYNSCAKKHISFPGVINAPSGINAHTGKKVLQVNTGNLNMSIPVFPNPPTENFDLQFSNVQIADLYETGGNIISSSTYPVVMFSTNNPQIPTTFGNFGASVGFNPQDTVRYVNGYPVYTHFFRTETSQYFRITESKDYTLNLSVAITDLFGGVPSSAGAGVRVKILTLDGKVVREEILSAQNSNNSINIFLCSGLYKAEADFGGAMQESYQASELYYSMSYSLSSNSISYKSLNTQSGCTYTAPIPASETMMNPTFSIPANKKMIFSAWVKESAFNANGYTDNEVQILSGGNSIIPSPLKPAGPVIEGWQRYEGEFTVPSNATEMTLRFVNNSGQPIYFDDIRIHPYNANMKSYVYDPVNLRLLAELDANNYASYYEYDEEGQLIRTKAETKEGIKTIRETRSAKQKLITVIQQ